MSRIAVLLAATLALSGCVGGLGASDSTPDEETEWEVTVERVVDGDTLEVRFPDGHTENVRLLGVDTPEVHVETSPGEFEGIPDTERGREWLRDWGHRSGEFARSELAGERVRIAVDPEADRRGGYDRLLVYVHHDGDLFNLELIERGYARLFDAPFTKRQTFEAAEEGAREAGVGLWGFDPDGSISEDSKLIPPGFAGPTPPAGDSLRSASTPTTPAASARGRVPTGGVHAVHGERPSVTAAPTGCDCSGTGHSGG